MFQGVCLSVLASVTFGVLYFYTQLLTGFGSEQTFGWRMISTLPFLTLLMWMIGDLHYIKQVLTQIKKNPWFIWLLIVSSVLVSLQLWLFLWAPMNGRGLEVSLGYFLLPLVLVLIGSLFYKEKLSRFQQIAVLLAILGVAHEIWQQGTIAWETALVAVGYSAYFFLRKKNENRSFRWVLVGHCDYSPNRFLFCIHANRYFPTMAAFLLGLDSGWSWFFKCAGVGKLYSGKPFFTHGAFWSFELFGTYFTGVSVSNAGRKNLVSRVVNLYPDLGCGIVIGD